MRIDVICILPEMLDGFVNNSIVKRAREKDVVEIHLHSLREYGKKNYRQVDDYAFGGGAGMVMMIEPVFELVTKLKSERDYDEIIYMSPDGEPLKQKEVNRLSILNGIIILCGHYKGVDHRVREHLVTKEISIGDYVVSGGELAAAVLIDAVTRIIPNAIGNEESALTDSFQDGLLAPPVYTRPPEFNGWKVPDILLSGNHEKIEQWKEEQAFERTKLLRPDLLK
jgi:tRNA (guanine37-N1)-methyltransferase